MGCLAERDWLSLGDDYELPTFFPKAACPPRLAPTRRHAHIATQAPLYQATPCSSSLTLANPRELDWDAGKVNVDAIALGHPATLCIGGGQGVVLAIER